MHLNFRNNCQDQKKKKKEKEKTKDKKEKGKRKKQEKRRKKKTRRYEGKVETRGQSSRMCSGIVGVHT